MHIIKKPLLFLLLTMPLLLVGCERKISTTVPAPVPTQNAQPSASSQTSTTHTSQSNKPASTTIRVLTPATTVVESPTATPAARATAVHRAVVKPARRAGAYTYRRNHP